MSQVALVFRSHITKTAQYLHPCSPVGLAPPGGAAAAVTAAGEMAPPQLEFPAGYLEYRRQQESKNLVPANPYLTTSKP